MKTIRFYPEQENFVDSRSGKLRQRFRIECIVLDQIKALDLNEAE
jgi:hypothetical protein